MVRTATGVIELLGSVPRIWPGETVVCLASGPSLTAEDAKYCRGKAKTIAINTTLLLAPWADVFYACDGRVWRWHDAQIRAFAGLKFSMDGSARDYGATILRNDGVTGLSSDAYGLRTGRNSGYQAINLAVLMGAARVILLGYDMKPGPDGQAHWHGHHPNKTQPPYGACLSAFKTIVEPLKTAGVEVLNCTRETALDVFPRRALMEVL